MLHNMLRAAAGRDRIPTDGLIAHYTMDNISGSTLVDETGNNDGTIYGAPQTAGVVDQALSFDGNDYVDLGDNLSFNTPVYTISFWFNRLNNSDIEVLVSRDNTTNTGTRFRIFQSRIDSVGKYQHIVFNSANALLASPSTTAAVDDGAWHNIIVEVSKPNLRIYVDNSVDVDVTFSGDPDPGGGAAMLLGAYTGNNDLPTLFYNGLMDDVFFYNRVLSPSERSTIYERGA